MCMMSKMSCGVLYAVKQCKEMSNEEAIAWFMSKYTDTPKIYYTSYQIQNIFFSAIGELLDCLEFPSFFWYTFTRYKQYPWDMNDFEAACSVLSEIRVKDGGGNYINGFLPFEQYQEEGFFK